jgi:hypothetical protein
MAEDRRRRRESATFICPPGVSWVVESDGILLLNRGTGRILRLGYPEAAVWDLASRDGSIERIVPKLGRVASCGDREARRIVTGCMEAWIGGGWLVRKIGNG